VRRRCSEPRLRDLVWAARLAWALGGAGRCWAVPGNRGASIGTVSIARSKSPRWDSVTSGFLWKDGTGGQAVLGETRRAKGRGLVGVGEWEGGMAPENGAMGALVGGRSRGTVRGQGNLRGLRC